MRSSRLSQETSKLFATMSPEPTSVLRRSTRTSTLAARFSYRDVSTTTTPITTHDTLPDLTPENELVRTADIEDAIPGNFYTDASPPPSTATRTARKRKRTSVTPSPRKIKVEVEVETETLAAIAPPAAKKPKGVRKPARVIKDPATGASTVTPPSDWEEVYAVVKEMRTSGAAMNAAVDTMGCERLADADVSIRDRRFHTLVALMLSSQTKDTVNYVAMQRLKNELPPYKEGAAKGLNLENMLAVEPELLNQLIWQVGFHNNKTKYLKQTALILRDQFASDIPPTIAGLTSLPGVGPKMAYLCMGADNGWNRVEGIGVDVHVHRITNLWGWHGTSPTKTPEETRLALQSWLPRDRWKEINWLLVGLGQTVCLPVGRKCGDCQLGARGLCRSADRGKVAAGKRLKAEEVKAEEVKGEVKGEVKVEGV